MNNIKVCDQGDFILTGSNASYKINELIRKYQPKSWLLLVNKDEETDQGHPMFNNEGLVEVIKSNGLDFINIPFSKKTFTDIKTTDNILKQLNSLPRPVIVQCNTARRSSVALTLLHAIQDNLDLKGIKVYAKKFDLLIHDRPEQTQWLYRNSKVEPEPSFDIAKNEMMRKKKIFLKTFGKNQYGYANYTEIDAIRKKDFKRMKDQIYLDYTGSGQYRESQLKAVFSELSETLLGNSHSHSPSSVATEYELDNARRMVLQFFNADESEYSVVFTPGATGALKIVGECFPFTEKSHFAFLNINHNSVVGIREYANSKGATITPLSERDVELCTSGNCPHISFSSNCALNPNPNEWDQKEISENSTYYYENKDLPTANLFVMPAEDNFCGRKYSLDWIEKIENKGLLGEKNWKVMIDAAAFVPTQKLDLTKYKPSFVDISFYKMFGYPTGLGALLVRNDNFPLLQRNYFSGGTIVLATIQKRFVEFSLKNSKRFEDGTLSFLNIAALKFGFYAIGDLGIENIEKHTYCLSRYLYNRLKELRHYNNTPVVKVFGKFEDENEREKQGPIVAFVAQTSNNIPIGYNKIMLESSEAGIHLRTGTHCNPGGANVYLDLSEAQLESLAKQKTSCGDEIDILENKHLGCVRISPGTYSTFEDVERFASWFETTYVEKVCSLQR